MYQNVAARPVMNEAELAEYLDEVFPEIHIAGRSFFVSAVRPGETVLRFEPAVHHLRPGGTVSGPSLFTLADLAAYAVILAHAGRVPLAVTTNLSMNFLRKPPPRPMTGTARLLKLGRRLAVTEVLIAPGDGGDLLAHATATYSLPPSSGNMIPHK
ncbi:MAG: PaaI family thioesterase [Hyphomicrobiaceae bacterium]